MPPQPHPEPASSRSGRAVQPWPPLGPAPLAPPRADRQRPACRSHPGTARLSPRPCGSSLPALPARCGRSRCCFCSAPVSSGSVGRAVRGAMPVAASPARGALGAAARLGAAAGPRPGSCVCRAGVGYVRFPPAWLTALRSVLLRGLRCPPSGAVLAAGGSRCFPAPPSGRTVRCVCCPALRRRVRSGTDPISRARFGWQTTTFRR